ncbi:hypothetical protein BPO_p0089 (plasmid) [Bergeyella porcorum]|uniref:Uncharacterized protein n=1 Tax=Bergeyella porcorum TaxID=1735111 RepID=A0AAU0F621_9FLAO
MLELNIASLELNFYILIVFENRFGNLNG